MKARESSYQTALHHHGKLIDRKLKDLGVFGISYVTTDEIQCTSCHKLHQQNRNCSNDRDLLVTDLTNKLSQDQLYLLSKGPKFALSQRIDDKASFEMSSGFCRFAYQYKWQQHRLRNRNNQVWQNVGIPKYPVSSTLYVPPTNAHDDALLKRLYHKVKNVFNSAKSKQRPPNISKCEKKLLEELKRLPLIYLPSDKGTEFCVIEEERYFAAGRSHLENETFYKKVIINKCDSIEKRINAVWMNICESRRLDCSIKKSFITRHSKLPTFYHLIKTHKKSSELKIRPIVANVDSPTKKLSWLLVQALRPLLKFVPAHLENSLELMKQIEDTFKEGNNSRTHKYPCSFDVVALYTSIPPLEAIRNVINILEREKYQFFSFENDDIQDLLNVVVSNTFFEFEGQQYQQVKGLPMGSSLSGFLAILFLDTIEKKTLSNFPHCPLFARYVDDCFALLRNEDDAEELLAKLNSQHPDIVFELEKPRRNSLDLLDFRVDLSTSTPIFSFYRKAAKKNIFMHADSSLPQATKQAAIKNEVMRIYHRSSRERDREESLQEFQHVLRLNGYSPNTIRDCTNDKFKRRNNNTKPLSVHYLYMPFLSDFHERKVKNIFRSEGINIRLYHKQQTLRRKLKRPTPPKPCRIRNCVMNNKDCLRKLVVYEVKCSCSASYIGSTIRTLHTRMHEHSTQQTSAIYRHRQVCNRDINVTILCQSRDAVDLRLREAIQISLKKPTLNEREENKDICSLIYI